ncbi:MAG: hypothetical protein BJ554DRAFT_1528 [Olpidium bornovanus]|uniref:Uncharacterized protein n=1 Tax=Olpidium bornovanus TaxID=278681 RepID=A0A8H7ZRM7_9FUNG|nr:MAG: hypothetical protein BJ554DRAFT_1528 [Olpidium bornovanus]
MRLPVLPFLACAAAATAVAAIPFSQDDFMLNSELPVDFDSPKMHALFAKLASLAAAPPPSPGGRGNRLARSMLTALCSSGCPRQETDAVEPGVNPALPPPSPTISLADPIAAEYAEALLKHDSRALYAMAECPVCLECMHPKTL